MKVLNKIICAFKGHSHIEKFLKETEGSICTHRCSRCKVTLMSGFTWKLKSFYPPNSTPKQKIEWEQFCEDKWQKLRNECKAV